MALILVIFLLPDSTCVLCHSDLRKTYETSIHTSSDIGCTACHGGVAGTLDMVKAHKGGFKGVPRRQKIPELCASCHSDPNRMRPFGLPIDQFLYYRSSYHGKAWIKGDTKTAVCTDCHSVHNILSTKDSRSHTQPRSMPEVCGRCHSDTVLMERYGLSPRIPAEYQESIHYIKILEGHPIAPTCATCHGSHGAAPPGVREVEEICGACHSRTKRAFDLSVHREAFLKKDLPECAVCHGNHKIKVYRNETFLKSCQNCHKEGGEALKIGVQIRTLFLSSEEALGKASSKYEKAIERGIPVVDLEPRLDEGRSYLLAAYPLSHSLQLDTLETSLRKARSIAEDIIAEIHEREGSRKEAIMILLLFWFYVLLTLGVAERKRRMKTE